MNKLIRLWGKTDTDKIRASKSTCSIVPFEHQLGVFVWIVYTLYWLYIGTCTCRVYVCWFYTAVAVIVICWF
jgi:hypothetical protein